MTTTLPKASAETQAYTHNAFDANGNLLWTSLPTTASTPAAVTGAEKTVNEYWDTGSIRTAVDPGRPKVRFDYTAEGWQSARLPEYVVQPGFVEYARAMYWSYLPDGLLVQLLDQGGQRALYDYDANGNRTQATEATGIQNASQSPLTLVFSFSSLDELTKVRTPKQGAPGTYMATTFAYDLHGNSAEMEDNREENGSGTETTAGRTFTYSYSALDRPVAQEDDLGDPATTTNDAKLTYTYRPTGELDTQTLQKRPSGSWVDEQSSVRTYFDNGQLKTLTNKNAVGPGGTMVSQHTLSYITSSVYQNGNRASDVFQLKGPDGTAACYSATCTASWTYDGRGRLTQEVNGTGQTTSFTLDVQGNVTSESTTGQSTITRTYSGQQLLSQTQGATSLRFIYDALGNVDCVTLLSYVSLTCPTPGSNLIEDNTYDYKNRLLSYRYYGGAGSASKSTDFTYDPLDRPISQTETISGATTYYANSYVGASSALSKEVLTGSGATTKKYSYDVFGRRATITDGANRYSYLYDPHSSVELLLDQSNNPKESYGYSAYGAANAALTKTAGGFSNKTNPYRYTGKRQDNASGSLDMGARRYGPATERFLQYDYYADALANLGLATDLLSGNRYSLAGGNPINFIEVDGHRFIPEADAPGDPSKNTICQVSPRDCVTYGGGSSNSPRPPASDGTGGRGGSNTGAGGSGGGGGGGGFPTGGECQVGRNLETGECAELQIGIVYPDLPLGWFGKLGTPAKWLWRGLRLVGVRGVTVTLERGAPLFAQRTASTTFGYGQFAGRNIASVAKDLRAGKISVSDLPLDVVRRGGEVINLNTKSAITLMMAGVKPSRWVMRDVSGVTFFETLLTKRLAGNRLAGGQQSVKLNF